MLYIIRYANMQHVYGRDVVCRLSPVVFIWATQSPFLSLHTPYNDPICTNPLNKSFIFSNSNAHKSRIYLHIKWIINQMNIEHQVDCQDSFCRFQAGVENGLTLGYCASKLNSN